MNIEDVKVGILVKLKPHLVEEMNNGLNTGIKYHEYLAKVVEILEKNVVLRLLDIGVETYRRGLEYLDDKKNFLNVAPDEIILVNNG